MTPVARSQRGLFPELQAWDKRARTLRFMLFDVRLQEMQDFHDRRPRGSVYEDQNQSLSICSWIDLTLKTTTCNYWGCAFLEKGWEVRCRTNPRAFGVLQSESDINITLWNIIDTAMFPTLRNLSEQSVRMLTTNTVREVYERNWKIILEASWECTFGSSSKQYKVLIPVGDRRANLAQQGAALHGSETSS